MIKKQTELLTTFVELVESIFSEEVENGDVFVATDGTEIVYKDGALRYLTSGGVITSTVAVTDDNLNSLWYRKEAKPELKKVTFLEAVRYLAEERKEVSIVVHYDKEHNSNGSYTVSNLYEFEELLKYEYLYDLYFNSEYYLTEAFEVEQEVEPEKSRESIGRKITAQDAYKILHQRHFLQRSVASLAEEYGITTRMVYYVLDGTYWKEVYDMFHEDFDVAIEDYRK